MKLVITDNHDHSARLAAQMMLEEIRKNPDALIGLPTGTTPIPVYEYMVKAVKEGKADFSRVRTTNLDEYVGLEGTDPNSYLYFMRTHLFDETGIDMSRVTIPNGMADPRQELARLNAFANDNTIDVMLLSVGVNGHIGFNEPSDRFYDGYHMVTLAHQTRVSNSRLFNSIDEVPAAAITMGVGGIMRSRKIVFLASGDSKLAAMKAMLEDGDVTPENQGTILKFHADCTIFLEEALASRISPAPYVSVERA